MRQAVIGILAHVDAGKTTLAEGMLHHAGVIRTAGRVDHGNTHLDTNGIERARGITIFSSQAVLEHDDVRLMLVDTPGHVDFSAEAERTLPVLDLAILIVAANNGVTGHTATLWKLLERNGVPTVVFVNKMDLAGADRAQVMHDLAERLSDACVDAAGWNSPALFETAAGTDEDALEEFLATDTLEPATIRRLVRERRIFPCFFGSALRDEGVTDLLDGLAWLVEERAWPEEFAARVYKVTHERGERIAWLKLTGGTLRTKDLVEGVVAPGSAVGVRETGAWAEKADQLRIYVGDRYETVPEVVAGQVCAVTGLSHVLPGDVLGAEPEPVKPLLAPVLSYRVDPMGLDVHTVYTALRELAEEDPMLGVMWDAELGEIRLMLMGTIQLEVVRERCKERLGADLHFGRGSILYKETITAPAMGYGHYEPLRHYAEVHLLLEPLPAGSGLEFGTVCSTDDLALNWQRLVLTNAMERQHKGVLTGAPIDDMRITLVSARTHLKHTEGGDIRQATYRAIRQALMRAKERGETRVIEPWYRFSLEIPQENVGRALADLTRMTARVEPPMMHGGTAVLEGVVPASELGDYALDVAAYTKGLGRLSMVFAGYEPCHDEQVVVARAAYMPEIDLPHTPDSIFCSHGAGYTVRWDRVEESMHIVDDPSRRRPWRAADAAFFSR